MATAILAAVLLLQPDGRAEKDEFRIGAGIFNFFDNGLDFQADFRPGGTPWLFGIRYVRWTEELEDPFFGTEPTAEETKVRTGAYVAYDFSPAAFFSGYVSVAFFRLDETLDSLVNSETDSVTLYLPYFGGGATLRIGDHFYLNLGLLLAAGGSRSMSTGLDTVEETGDFDIQVQLGFAF